MSVRITTFGGVAIQRAGATLPELPAQSLRCALLVHLAVEGEVAREEVMAMFWPGRKGERARHSLNQAVYQLRNVLGRDVIRTAGELLRIGDEVAVDTVEFERAMAAGDHAQALRVYRGHFLAGDPLPAGKAFAAWVGRQRDRFGAAHRAVRRERIGELLEDGDAAAALAVARDWVTVDPLDDEAQRRLNALVPRSAAPPPPSGRAGPRAVPVPGPGRNRRGLLLVAALSMAVVVVTLALGLGRDEPSGPEVGTGTAIGVVPFAGLGMPPDSSASIQAAFVSALAWPDGWSSADVVVAEEEAGAGPARDGTVAPPIALRVGRERGLSYVVTGQVGDGPGRSGLRVSAWDVASATRVFDAVARPEESPEDASARLAYQLVRDLAEREGARLPLPLTALHGTRSATARGHFLRGRQHMGRGDGAAARDAFLRAAAADPVFGQAWFRAGVAHPEAGHAAMLTLARDGLGHRDGMAPRAVGLLEGLRAYALRRADEAVSRFQRLTQEDGDDPDAWYGLAISLHHLGASTGHDPERARAAFDRLLRLDSGYAAVRTEAFDLALWAGDLGAAAELMAVDVREADTGGDAARRLALTLTLALATGGGEAWEAALDSARWHDRATIMEAARVLARASAHLPALDALGAVLQESIRTPSDQAAGARLRFLAAVGRGERVPAELLEGTSGTEETDPLLALARLAGGDDDGEPLVARDSPPAAEAAPDFIPAMDHFGLPMGHPRRVRLRAAVARAAAHGEPALVTTLIHAIRDAGTAADSTDPMPAALEHALRARQALLAGDTTAALRSLGEALSRPAWPHLRELPLTCMADQRLLAARLSAARGDSASARRWSRTFGPSGCIADPLFLPALSRAGLISTP